MRRFLTSITAIDFKTTIGAVLASCVNISGCDCKAHLHLKERIVSDLLRLERDSSDTLAFQLSVINLYVVRVDSDTLLYSRLLHEAVVRACRVLPDFSKLFYSHYFCPRKPAIPYESFMVCIHADTSNTPSGLNKNVAIIQEMVGERRVYY